MNSTWTRARAALAAPHSPWVSLACATLAVLVYLNVLPNTFIFDDWQLIVENPFLRRPDALQKILTTGTWPFMEAATLTNFYRPLMDVAFYAQFRLFGLNPGAYHALSILLHAGVCLLVYNLIARLSGNRRTAVAAALLFAAHPVHTQAVAWISAYPDLLCAFFSLLAMWLYLRAEEARGAFRLTLQMLVGPAFLLALLSKEIALAVPLLLAGYELLVRRAPWPARLRAVWPAYASVAVSAAVGLAARFHALQALMPVRLDPIPAGERLWTCLALFFRYFWVQIWPLRLRAFYYLDRNRSPLEPLVLAGLGTALATSALVWWLYRRRRPEALAVPLYLLPLAPAFLLPYASLGLLMAEHYLYLPSVGFCWLLAAALVAAGERWRYRPVGALFVLLLAAYSARTVIRNRHWGDEIAFYRLALSDSPGFARGHLYLGHALLRRNHLTEAVEPAQTAARLLPAHPEPHMTLGVIYWRQGDSESAIWHFRHAATIAERAGNGFAGSRAMTSLGAVYLQAGRLEEAVAASRQALQVDPRSAGAYNNLGYALLVLGDVEEATRNLHAAVELEPALDAAHANLGLAYAMRQEWENALAYLRRAEQLNPRSGEVHARLGEVYRARGQLETARQEFSLALRLDPWNERARGGLRALRETP